MHTEQSLRSHPNLNPDYYPSLERRRSAQKANREVTRLERLHKKPLLRVPVPKQVNRYLPHYGVKEAARYAGKTDLGRL